MSEIKRETGEKREFSTGATKQAATGKGRPSLVPGDAVLEVSKHFEGGIEVHGERNWEKGIPLSVWLDSLERHLQQLKMGMTDEPHARALVWNALVYLATKLRIENGLLPAELDDMPVYTTLEERLDKEEIGVTDEVAKEFGLTETLEETVEINEELAEKLTMKKVAAKGPVEVTEVFKDTMTSNTKDDGKWYCNYSWDCIERGVSNVAPNTFICGKHIEEWREEHGK